MPDKKKLDPFRPSQPQIPGVAPTVLVPETAPASPADIPEAIPQRKNSKWIIASVAAALVVGAGFAWWTHISSSRNSLRDAAASAADSGEVTSAAQPAAALANGPGEIASTEELSKPWSSKQFLYHNALTGVTVPAMVVRLPGGKYWGFSLREPYGKCDMELVTDLQKLQTDYSFRAAHPMVGDPCDRSVFDLTRYTTAPGGLVRGEIEQGPAIRPPVAIEISTRGDKVLAERME